MAEAPAERDDEADENVDPTYIYKPSLLGAPSMFVLRPDALQWQLGNYSGRVRYERITFIRMSFRPVTLQMHRYLTEIWSSDNPKVQFASASWRSITEQERLDAAYVEFARELHRRVAASGGKAQLLAGMPPFSYWVGVVVFAGACLAMAGLVIRALQLGEWAAAGMIGGLFLLFGYQLGQFFGRNRPGRYRADDIPRLVLPKPQRQFF